MQPVSIHSPLIKRARQEAVFTASSMIDRCVEAARASLEEAERRSGSVALRLQLSDALAGLLKHRGQLRTAFPAQLDQAFLSALDAAHVEAGLPVEVSEDDLALVDDAEVSRFVEASRLQQAVMPVVEQALARLDSLMSSALGLPVVRAELNPLRPDVLCNALQSVVEQVPESPEVRSHWVRHFASTFAAELNRLYEGVADMLEAQGVEEARYRLKLTEGGPVPAAAPEAAGGGGGGGGGGSGGGGNGGGGSGSGGGGSGGGESERTARPLFPKMSQLAQARPAVPHALMRDFLYRPQWIEEYDEPLPAAYYDDARAQAAAVAAAPADPYNEKAEARARARERALSVVDRPARAVAVDSPLPPQQWGEQASAQARTRTLMELKTQASKVSQVLGLDAVRTLVGQVAGDQRVLAPVREAFVALEPALLRAAMDDPRFFGNDSHPARRLIEEVAQRSFKYNDEFAEDFEAFMAPVRQAVRELSAAPQPAKQDFADRMQGLQAQWQAQDEEEKQAVEPGMQSMRFAQERQELADKIAWEFGLRSDLEGVPGKVADFLFQDWSLVIAHAQLTAERSQLDPGGYLAVVTDLLWSVKPQVALRQPARLFEVVPGVVSTLRRGLDMLGKEPAETQSFFDALMRYHDPVLRLRRMRSARDAEASGFGRLPTESELMAFDSGPLPLERPRPRAAEQPWLGRAELAAAGFDDVETAPAPLTESGALDDEFASTLQTAADDDESGFAPTEPWQNEAPASVPAVDSPAPPEPAPANGFVPLDQPPEPAAEPPALAEAAPAAQAVPMPRARVAESEDEIEARTRATLARLRTGDWVDLRVRGVWRRAQLTWSSDNGSLFMFVSQGGRPHSMTRRTCEKLIRARYLRLVDAGAVVDKALRSLSAADGKPAAKPVALA
ncbi:DUF1631 family protein [Ottowia sp.]|uniref:DUF1631 family protein n=1 Tax=Ottowia sp. TaxID=1898956 RepID=UPI0039E5BE56